VEGDARGDAVGRGESHWDLIDPLARCWPIGLKWVYKAKRDEHGAIVKHKAWLVAHGFVQWEGIDLRCSPRWHGWSLFDSC
jgi:hypothetical protein